MEAAPDDQAEHPSEREFHLNFDEIEDFAELGMSDSGVWKNERECVVTHRGGMG